MYANRLHLQKCPVSLNTMQRVPYLAKRFFIVIKSLSIIGASGIEIAELR